MSSGTNAYFNRHFTAGQTHTFRVKGARGTIYAYNYSNYGNPGSTVAGVLTNSAGQTMTVHPYYEQYYDIEYYALSGSSDDYTFTVTSTVEQQLYFYMY